jgi:hypothetical protein
MRGTTTVPLVRPRTVAGLSVVEVDPREGGRKAVRIAFAADFAVGDDVDASALTVADREPGRIVLCLFRSAG